MKTVPTKKEIRKRPRPERDPQAHNAAGKPPHQRRVLSAGEDDRRKCLMTTYDGHEIIEEVMPYEEAMSPDRVEEVDFYRNDITGRISIRKQDGKRLEYFGQVAGCGKTGTALYEELMWLPGELQSRWQLARNPRLHALMDPRAMASRLHALRVGFGETAVAPWYFLVRRTPLSLCWNRERTWRIIEWLAGPGKKAEAGTTA